MIYLIQSDHMQIGSNYNHPYIDGKVPSIDEDTRTDEFIDSFLICITMINRMGIALLIYSECIMRPKWIIIMKCLLLTISLTHDRRVTLHLHAEFGSKLFLPLVKRPYPHPNFNTHINNKLCERRQLNSPSTITLILILMLQQMEHKRLASRVLNTLQFIRRGLNNEE